MKTVIFGAIVALSLAAGTAKSEPAYHAPAHNFYQNNWMAGGGG